MCVCVCVDVCVDVQVIAKSAITKKNYHTCVLLMHYISSPLN